MVGARHYAVIVEAWPVVSQGPPSRVSLVKVQSVLSSMDGMPERQRV